MEGWVFCGELTRVPSSQTAVGKWLEGRVPDWQRLSELLTRQRDRKSEKLSETLELVQRFRGLARDVSLARGVMPDGRLTRELEGLFLRAHEAVYRRPNSIWQQLLELMRDDVPAVTRELRNPLAASLALFLGSMLVGWWLVTSFPELAALFASETMIDMVQRGELWTDGLLNVIPSSVLSFSIMANNIAVSLTAFALGALYGLGTVYILGLNGLMLGGVFALTAQHDLAGRLFSFVIAHGVVELSIIFLAGAAGIHLGEALARPGSRSRSAAFRAAVSRGAKLLPVCVLFLVGCGLIEGYVSPDERYSLVARSVVGVSYGLLFWLVLSGWLWRWSPKVPPASRRYS